MIAFKHSWANAGWHRPEGYAEVQTPAMNALVKDGIELDQAYSFKFCENDPTRVQSPLPFSFSLTISLAPLMPHASPWWSPIHQPRTAPGSPTRSSLQSGRLPVHVNMVNPGPELWNPVRTDYF